MWERRRTARSSPGCQWRSGTGSGVDRRSACFRQTATSFIRRPVRVWDVSTDGQRFLMLTQGEGRGHRLGDIVMVRNWFQELLRLVPVD